jgi:hypothetical protein
VSLARAITRLVQRLHQRPSPAAGVVTVVLDGSKAGVVAPQQIAVFPVTPGEHSLQLRFLGGLRRSRTLTVALAEGDEKAFVGVLNGFAWPSLRPATPSDVAAMKGCGSPGDALRFAPEDGPK